MAAFNRDHFRQVALYHAVIVLSLRPLPRAASLGHFEVVQVLSAYGADFTVAASSGENAMHFATMANRLLCIRLLGQRG